jgi:hypothetical protein
VQVFVERKHGELIINAASAPLSQTKPLNKYAKIIAVKTFNAFIFTPVYFAFLPIINKKLQKSYKILKNRLPKNEI